MKYQNYVDIFNKKKSKRLSEHNQIDYVIKIKNDKKFSFKLIYNLSITELKILRKYVKNNFKKKFIVSFFFFDKRINVICVQIKR